MGASISEAANSLHKSVSELAKEYVLRELRWIRPLSERRKDEIRQTLEQNPDATIHSICRGNKDIAYIVNSYFMGDDDSTMDSPGAIRFLSKAEIARCVSALRKRGAVVRSGESGSPVVEMDVPEVKIGRKLFGPYRIIQDTGCADPRVALLVGGVAKFSQFGVIHPHVSNGTPCMGTSADVYDLSITVGDIHTSFSMLATLLRSYNESSPYKRVHEFKLFTCTQCLLKSSSVCPCVCRACGSRFCPECVRQCPSCYCLVCDKCASPTGDCALCSKE